MGEENRADEPAILEHGARRMFNVAALLLILSFVIFLCQLISLSTSRAEASGLDRLPVSIRAASRADYHAAESLATIPPVQEEILREIILDMPATGAPRDRMATLQSVLSSPVPTMTPDRRLPATATPLAATSTRSQAAPTRPITMAMTFMAPTRFVSPTQTTVAVYPSVSTPAPTSTKATKQPTRTPAATRTPTPSPTATPSPSKTSTPTQTPSGTATPTSTNTPTSTPTATRTPSPSATLTDTPTSMPSATTTQTPTETASATATPTETPTETATGTPSTVPTATETASPTATASSTPTTTYTLTDTPTATPTPSETPTPTLIPTLTPSPTETATQTFTLTASPASTDTPTFTPTETPTLTSTPTHTPTSSGTSTPSVTATTTSTATPTETETPTPTAAATHTPTSMSTPSSTPSPTDTPSPTATPGLPACYSGTPGGILPSDDTYIDGGSPTRINGSDNTFEVRPDNGADRRALLKFDLSSVPANATVSRATLYLYERGNKTGQITYLYRLTSNWSESTATWQTWSLPGGDFDNSVSYFTYLPDQNNCMVTLDITSLVRAWVNGTYDNYGLMLFSTGPNHIIPYSSKEDGTASEQPRLDIIYSVATSTP